MITLQLQGGLGNQMFQYALGKAIAHTRNTEVVLDLTALNHRIKAYAYIFREFDLPIFTEPYTLTYLSRLPAYLHNGSFIAQTTINSLHKRLAPHTYIREKSHAFDPQVLESPDGSYITGYWQSPKYFESIESDIREIFTHFTFPLSTSSESLIQSIRETNAVCMNFRRTDYVEVAQATKFHGVMGDEYYAQAVEYIASRVDNPHFFIFSDDIAWCREHIKLPFKTTFVGHEYAGVKFSDYLQLMIACSHFIIPNSTFAWWAAWLNNNPGKIVIAPKQWLADPKNTITIVPDAWVRI